MKLKLLLLAALLASPALAADPERPEMTVQEVLDVGVGLQQLVKAETADKDGRQVSTFYKFGSDVRIAIAVNLQQVRTVQTAFASAYNDLVLQWSSGTGNVPDDKKGLFGIEANKLSQAKTTVVFQRIKKADLKLDENPIPGPVLSLILPIVDR